MIDLFAGGQRDAAYHDRINIGWYLRELMLSYKFGEKLRYEKAFARIKPYLSDDLVNFFEEIHEQSLWLNPITTKRGY